MDLLRRHMFLIVCVTVAIAGIGLLITGARAMPGVLEEMNKVGALHRDLNSLQSQPVNLARIDAARERSDLLVEDRDKVVKKATQLYGYEPLVSGSLPDGDALKRNDFKNVYNARMEELLKSLNYGPPASPADVAMWRSAIEEEQAARREIGLDRAASPSQPIETGAPRTPAGVLTKAGAREEPRARASMYAAQKIRCYARHFKDVKPPDRVASLDFWPAMESTGMVDAPDIWDVWQAQLGYWIQKDVVDAIVSLNDAAAQQAEKDGEDAWVGNMPVKEVISVRLSDGYVPRDGEEIYGSRPGGYNAALPPGTPETVFTHSGADEMYEVIQFSVKLVMDQRDIPLLIDRLSKESFHTLLRVSYQGIPPNRDMTGKIYGSEPAVNVLLEFETLMLGDVFRGLMPQSVCEFYEINCT